MECLREIGIEQSGCLPISHNTPSVAMLILNIYCLSALVREYHKTYYRPDNLCLIITGKVDRGELLNTLDRIDRRILSKGELPPMIRPWVDEPPIPPLKESIEEVLEFPDEDESIGEVMFAWMGPKIHVRL